MKLPWIAPLALALLALGGPARAEMFRCVGADGGLSFQQLPCAQPQPPAPVVVTPAVPKPQPQFQIKGPPPLPPAARAAAAADPMVVPTRRKREVLAVSAQLERCRRDQPGFAEKSQAIYQAWQARHAVTLAEFQKLLAIRVRAARHGEMGLPLGHCTDEWLRELEPLTRSPEARFATVEKTWQVLMGALMTGDRATATACFAGAAQARWKQRMEAMSGEELRRIGASVRALNVQWGDDYAREGVVADTDNRVVAIAFRNINEEWKITELGAASTLPAPAGP